MLSVTALYHVAVYRVTADIITGQDSQVRVPTIQRGEAAESSWPVSAADRVAVREQLDRILASALFKNSKRYPGLLRYVVDRTLEGRAGELKERTLGVEVFSRTPDYDTNLDPVVRISAAEIRKRIAQYYHEAGHEDEIRIDLPVGSYVPEFRISAEKTLQLPVPVEIPVSIGLVPEVPRKQPPRTYPIGAAVGILALAMLAVLVFFRPWSGPAPLDSFWGPVLDRDASVLLCIGHVHDPDGIATASGSPTPRLSQTERAFTVTRKTVECSLGR